MKIEYIVYDQYSREGLHISFILCTVRLSTYKRTRSLYHFFRIPRAFNSILMYAFKLES